MRHAKLYIVLRFQRERKPRPGEETLPLRDHPVLPAIEVDCDDRGYGRLSRDEGCDGACRGDLGSPGQRQPYMRVIIPAAYLLI